MKYFTEREAKQLAKFDRNYTARQIGEPINKWIVWDAQSDHHVEFDEPPTDYEITELAAATTCKIAAAADKLKAASYEQTARSHGWHPETLGPYTRGGVVHPEGYWAATWKDAVLRFDYESGKPVSDMF